MITWKILIFLTLAAATSFANCEFLSDQRVFLDDEKWSSSGIKQETKHLEIEANDPETDNVCRTKECKMIAEEFLSSMNKSIDPCDDFYGFVCGEWTADTIPASFPVWNRFGIFQNTVYHRIKEILEMKIESSDLLPVKQAKKWYRSCMDTDTLENEGIKPIESFLNRAGGWPIVMDDEKWDPEEYNWQNVDHYYAHFTGEYTFYKIGVSPFSDVEETGRLMLTASPLPLSEHSILKYRNYSASDYDEYVHLIYKVADLFVHHSDANVSKRRLMKEAREIVEFEKEIYELDQNNSSFEGMTLEEFYNWYETNVTSNMTDPNAKIAWKLLMQDLFDTINIKLDLSSNIFVSGVEFFGGFAKLLAKTSRRTIVNYIHWKFVGNMLTYTTEAMREKLFRLDREEFGVKERPSRWHECVKEIKMAHAVSYVFVDKYFTNHTKTAAHEMIKNIQIEMEEQIENSDWLDTESKAWAKDKLNSIKMLVGFPDWYKNETELINYYEGLNIGANYFENTLNYMRYENRKELRRYENREIGDRGWLLDPITFNTMYLQINNNLNVPAAVFQPPLLTPHFPDNINYGVAGVLIGHEMSHGFDDKGIQFGKDLFASTLSDSTLKNYYQTADCFLDQFDEFFGETGEAESEETSTETESKPYKRKKSLITRGENIADTTGIQTVYEAYRKLKKPETGSLRLPGFEEFTDDQMFFISFSATWCEIGTPQYEKKKERVRDQHSPAKFRVNGSVSNTKAFAKVFNCPADSPMNPANKCNIWKKSNVTPKTKSSGMKKKRGS